MVVFLSWKNSQSLNEKKETQTLNFSKIEVNPLTLSGLSGQYSIAHGEILKDNEKLDLNTEQAQRVLRLALFYRWVKEYPLLFDPYMNQERYVKSVGRFTDSMGYFINVFSGTKISPVLFIKKFGQSSREYREFETDISEEKALRLLSAIKDTQKAYIEDAIEIEKTFLSLQSYPQGSKKIAFLGGETFTDTAGIIADLKIIQRNGELLALEIERREKCLMDSAQLCLFSSKQLSAPIKIDDKIDNPSILSRDIMEVPSNGKLRGPYRVNSSCWNKRDYQWLFLFDNCSSDNNDSRKCSPQPFLADNKYFNTVGNDPVGMKLIEMGIEITPMGVTAPYTCNDFTYDVTLRNIDYFFEKYSENKFFDKIDTLSFEIDADFEKLIENGKSAEQEFFSAKYPSQNSLEYLGEYYLHAYNYGIENGVFNQNERDELLFRGILIKSKLSSVSYSIDTLSIFIEKMTNKFAINGLPSLLYVYPTKSAYSLLFFNFASSVWLSEEKLHFLDFESEQGNIFKMNSQKFMDFKTAADKYGENNLVFGMKKYRELKNGF